MENKEYRLVIRLSGIHCVGCFNRIEQALTQLDAQHIDLDPSTNIGKIDYIGNKDKAQMFIDAIHHAGYQVEYLTLINNSF